MGPECGSDRRLGALGVSLQSAHPAQGQAELPHYQCARAHSGSGTSLWTRGRRTGHNEGMREALFYILSSFWAGAVHAATPGHGKTIAAAYIVGARGRPIDALILGVFVTLSHTSGIVLVGVLASLGSAWLDAAADRGLSGARDGPAGDRARRLDAVVAARAAGARHGRAGGCAQPSPPPGRRDEPALAGDPEHDHHHAHEHHHHHGAATTTGIARTWAGTAMAGAPTIPTGWSW